MDEQTLLSPLSRSGTAKIEKNESGYVFENKTTGKPYTDVKKAFPTALKDAGITNFRFYDLRHTFGTYALLNSMDLRATQELLGHQRVSTTQKYVHVLASQKRNVIDQTSSFFAALMDKKTDKISEQSEDISEFQHVMG